MAAAIPRLSRRPSYGPPTSALPALPTAPTKVSNNCSSTSETERGTINTTKSGLRTPSSSYNTKHTPARSTTLPRHTTITDIGGAPKTLKKPVSMSAFPQPPRGNRTTSLPPSPLSAGKLSNNGSTLFIGKKTNSVDTIIPSDIQKKKKKSDSPKPSVSYGSSFLNGSGNGKSVVIEPGTKSSEYLLNLPSPPQSRSSSSQDSYPPIDQHGENRGRDSGGDHSTHRRTSKPPETKGNVLVSIRVRPDAGSNVHSKSDGEWMVDGRRSLVAFRGKEGGDYYYDNVFTSHDNNAKVYDASAKRLVRRVMEGYHGTVFAYGMTGTGKTFSMQGTTTSPGVIPLAITDIFSFIRETPSREFLLRVSYLEIYNEKIHDLLVPPGSNGANQSEEIKLREDSKRGVYASSLKEEIVQSPTQLLRVIARGDQARRTSSTQFNSRSSRSHAVVQIVVESRERIPAFGLAGDKRSAITPGGVRVSTLSLIDLAGSERAADNKERRTEGSHINKSLLTLGTVIAKLSGNKDKEGKPTDKDGKHLPYRDSKLTRLLQSALSGNSLISILCTIQIGSAGSAASSNTHTAETLNTLKFASRAKNNIISHAKKAEEALGQGEDGSARVLLERYRIEILDLRSQLEVQAKAKQDEEEREREKEAEHRHDEQMLEMQLARTALRERIEHLNRLILSSKSTGVNTSRSYSSLGLNQRLSTNSVNGYTSVMSTRSSMTSNIGRNLGGGERCNSESSVSAIAQNPGQKIQGGRLSPGSLEDDESLGEYGDGVASLAAQNRALQADLADKTRYCQTLEKRLIQARRSSHSRMSLGFSNSAKNIIVCDDKNMAILMKEKDIEIADLKARLDDKDRMLTALRSSARCRDLADRDPRCVTFPLDYSRSSDSDRASLSAVKRSSSHLSLSPRGSHEALSPTVMHSSRESTKGVDEMSKILDEMIQDRVETGQLIKGIRGGIRIVNDRKSSLQAT